MAKAKEAEKRKPQKTIHKMEAEQDVSKKTIRGVNNKKCQFVENLSHVH